MRGVDILLVVNTGTDAVPVWTVVGGQRGATISESNETIDTTSKTTVGFFEYDYGLGSWTVSADGAYVLNDMAFEELKTACRNKEKIKIRVKEGTAKAEEGYALITSMERDAPYDGELTYSFEFQGTGPLTTITLP
jgi:TP901-1 family phage major tail protein